MEKNIYPYDAEALEAATRFGKVLGTLLIENALNDMTPEWLQRIAFVNGIKLENVDVKYVYNWVFEGVASVLRNTETRKEVEQAVASAKQNVG